MGITPKNWLLFQLRPGVKGFYDIFLSLFFTLQNLADDIYLNETTAIIGHIIETQQQEQFNIVLDEAQCLARMLPGYFPRVLDPAIVDRRLLSPVIYALSENQFSRLSVCGSALSLLMCEELLQSPIAKWSETCGRFVNLGVVDKFEEFTKFVQSYVPAVDGVKLSAI